MPREDRAAVYGWLKWWPISDWSTSWLSGILWLLVSSINWSVVGRVSIRFHLCSACLIQSPCIDVGRWIDLKWWLVSDWFGRRRWLYEKADHTGLTFTQLSDALYETVGPELTDPSTRPLLLLLPPPQRLSSSVRWRIGWSDDVSIRSHYFDICCSPDDVRDVIRKHSEAGGKS